VGGIAEIAHHDVDGITVDEGPRCVWKSLLDNADCQNGTGEQLVKEAVFHWIGGTAHHVNDITKQGDGLFRVAVLPCLVASKQGLEWRERLTVYTSALWGKCSGTVGNKSTSTAPFMVEEGSGRNGLGTATSLVVGLGFLDNVKQIQLDLIFWAIAILLPDKTVEEGN